MELRSATSQVSRAFWEKIALGGGAAIVFTVIYRAVQEQPWRTVTMRADCASWRWLAFDPAWVWPYCSMFVLVGAAWMSLPEGRAVRRFGVSLLAVAAVGWILFLVWPTGCVRPFVENPPLAYRWLVALDRPTNCFPCLHSAFAVIAAVSLVRSWRFRWLGRLLVGVWLAAIGVSIVALRQHTDVDTLVGAALGAAGAWLDGRRATIG